MSVRIWAGAATLVFAALLAWVAIATFRPKSIVTPTVNVAAAKSGEPSPSDVLAQRTELQAEDSVANGAVSARLASEGERIAFGGGVEKGRAIVSGWLRDTGEGATSASGMARGSTGAASGTEGAAAKGKLLQPPAFREGISSLPYQEANVLVQPQGRTFRRSHEDWLRWTGGWLILGTCLALALFLLGRGRIKTAEGESGAVVERFNSTERATHWMTASAFLIMAVTGLVILYGKPLLLPWMGADAFSSLARGSAWVHMASTVPFVLGIVMMIVMWLPGNLWARGDWEWLRRGGGFMRDDGHNPPADRFNAGQKFVFWAVVLGGLALLATGVVLMLPFYMLGYTGMQWAQLLHAGIALLMVALILGHIYIGTVGMSGAFHAMWSGLVDRNWAREHHRTWYNRLTRGEPGE